MTFAAPSSARASDSPQAREYNRLRRRLAIADFLIGFALMVVLLLTGWTLVLRDWSYQAAGQSYPLAVFFYVAILGVCAKALTVGIDYYAFRVERAYGLSRQKLRGWIWDAVKSGLIGLLLSVVVVELVYWTIRVSPDYWWLLAWGLFVGLSVFFAQLAPVVLFPLFYKFEPLENPELRDRLLRLTERAHTRVRGVYEWKLSAKSARANAALTGLGRTRRIILSDTLLESFSVDEIEAVMAHELGHHVYRHVPKALLLHCAITFLGFWMAAVVLRYFVITLGRFDRLSDFANLPLLALAATLLSLLLMPVLNAYSRHNERQADRYCFRAIPAIEPFISSMNKLAVQNLAERQPSPWVEWFFHSHPAISRRIQAAEVFSSRQPS